MKLFTTLATATVFALGALSANATTYQITDSINSGANGFGSSGFHDQATGQASGAYLTKLATGTISGAYDDSIAGATNFYFSGDLVTTGGAADGSFTAVGELTSSGMGRPGGLFGDIVFTIVGSATAGLNVTQTFSFADLFHNAEANGISGPSNAPVIALWGDNGLFSSGKPGLKAGLDLRLQLEEGGDFNDPEPVPLPATALLLIGALGGLGGMRKLRKKS